MRRRHRRHRNPINVGSLGGFNWGHALKPAAVIGSSVVLSMLLVEYATSKGWITPLTSPWQKYAAQAAIGVGGVMLLKKVKPEFATYWGMGALTSVAIELFGTYVAPSIRSMLVTTTPAPVATAGFRGVAGRGMGAFPRDVRGMGAFPGQVSRVSSPYDRSSVYPY